MSQGGCHHPTVLPAPWLPAVAPRLGETECHTRTAVYEARGSNCSRGGIARPGPCPGQADCTPAPRERLSVRSRVGGLHTGRSGLLPNMGDIRGLFKGPIASLPICPGGLGTSLSGVAGGSTVACGAGCGSCNAWSLSPLPSLLSLPLPLTSSGCCRHRPETRSPGMLCQAFICI